MKKTMYLMIICMIMSLHVYGMEITAVNADIAEETLILSLEDITNIALGNSPAIETAKMETYKAEIDAGDAKDSYDGHQNIYPGVLSVSTVVSKIMTGKGYYYDLAVLSVQNKKRNEEFVRDDIEIEAINSYYNVLYKKENLKLKKRTLETAKSKYDEVKLKFDLGKASGLDLRTAENNYLDAVTNAENAENDFVYSLQQLNVFLGYDYDKKIDIEGELSFSPFKTSMMFDEMYTNALDNSSIYQGVFYNYERARLTREITMGALASTNVGKEARADAVIAENNLNKTRNSILLSVLGDLLSISKLEKSIDTYSRQVELYKDKVKLKETEYKLGLATITDVLDEQARLQQAELSLLSEKKNYCVTVRDFENTISK